MKSLLSLIFLLLSLTVSAQNEHTVKNGENLQSIVKLYNLSLDDLKKANPGLDDYVFAGMVLKLPPPTTNQGDELYIGTDNLNDVIHLKDGSELVAKIVSIESTSVKFEQYDTNDLFSINKDLISSIVFEDGRTTTFDTPKKIIKEKKKK